MSLFATAPLANLKDDERRPLADSAPLFVRRPGALVEAGVEEAPSLNRLQKYIEPRNALVLGVAADEDPIGFFLAVDVQGDGLTTRQAFPGRE